ncbi:flagellar hook capping FlgD N-terminal domain-containing protein [Ruegeria arenilitoris]|uniref:flagellar hook capping FlgD N-terminal domain-containing protein n=1 Tax=Ruegeria arenilitoris TaxID=1173585 RepID=UPI00147FC110|nr:flagellar hook capping FlgD N-terminal domain-containing protein [Ruegeria arenilitoris]
MTTSVNFPSQSTPAVENNSKPRASILTSDFETFIKMLTTQARYQDPLKPLDSAEYASQLAQFSMVEQQVQANELLSGLAVALSGSQLDKMSNWVGTEVHAATAFRYDGEPVAIETHAEPHADRAELVFRDADGVVVARVPVPVEDVEYAWAGEDSEGEELPQGVYSATLESYKGRDKISNNPAAVYSRVVEAQMHDGEVALKLDSGAIVLADSITSIRKGA